MTARICFSITLLLVLQACSHPLEIEGEGDIVNWSNFGSADGTHSCSLEQYRAKDSACTKNFAITNYDVIYHAAPKQGWVFAGWKGICEDKGTSICPLKIAAEVVPKFWFKTMPATIAVFNKAAVAKGNGPALTWSRGVVADVANKKVYLSNGSTNTLISVEMSSGNRRVISSKDQALPGQAGNYLNNLSLDKRNNRVLGLKWNGDEDRLIAVDLSTGERTVIASTDVGAGEALDSVVDMYLDVNRQMLYLASNINGFNGIAVLDLDTGNRSIISSADGSVGQGPVIPGGIGSMTYDSLRNELVVVVADTSDQQTRIFRINPNSGKRELMPVNAGEGWIAYEPSRDRLILTRGDRFYPLEYVDMNMFYDIPRENPLFFHQTHIFDEIGNTDANYDLGRVVFPNNEESTYFVDESLSALVKLNIYSGYYQIISR